MKNSYLSVFLFAVGTVVLLSNFGNCESLSMDERMGVAQMGPISFEERKDRRKRQAKPAAKKPVPPGHEEGNQILTVSFPNCEEDGMIFMNGYPDSYYVKCVRDIAHGGFYRVIYVCPRDARSATDSSVCVPPPECASSCGDNNYYNDVEANSLV